MTSAERSGPSPFGSWNATNGSPIPPIAAWWRTTISAGKRIAEKHRERREHDEPLGAGALQLRSPPHGIRGEARHDARQHRARAVDGLEGRAQHLELLLAGER